jgi:hypothetical protein
VISLVGANGHQCLFKFKILSGVRNTKEEINAFSKLVTALLLKKGTIDNYKKVPALEKFNWGWVTIH